MPDAAGTGAGRELTPITPEGLLKSGYREWPNAARSGERRFFQRAFDDAQGRRFFLNFREWNHHRNGRMTYDAQVATEVDGDGYVWITIQLPSIQETEEMAERLWRAAGGIYYDA